jgi:hypothetical protein
MRAKGVILGVLAGLVICSQAAAQNLGSLAGISNQDAVQALKDALVQGSGKAVSQLSASDGFLGNPKVRIPLPDTVKRVESGLRMLGMGRQADELVVSMNRAAEMAVKEATPLLVGAVKSMSVADAKGILAGPDDAATERVQLAQQYNGLAGQAAQYGLISKEDSNIDLYVTRKALDGLFIVIAEQERMIRRDPMGAATSVAKKVFSSLR